MYQLKTFKLFFIVIFLFSCLSLKAQDTTTLPSKIELIPFKSQNFKVEDFLTKSVGSEPVYLAGELRIPQGGKSKYPAVILVHGSSGISSSIDRWVHSLNAAGFATYAIDSFTGRGIENTRDDQTQLNSYSMMEDTFRALDTLSKHDRIDANKISVMGFSKGAVSSIFSSIKRLHKLHGSNAHFAAHVGLYTPCNTRLNEDTELSGAPIRLFHGTTDDYVSVKPCRSYVKELKEKGFDVSLKEFENTDHSYDSPLYINRVSLPKAQSTRNCSIVEKRPGELISSSNGKPFSCLLYTSDAADE